MEPMDLDDDSLGHIPPPTPTHPHRPPYLAAPCSPILTPSAAPSPFFRASALSFSTPQPSASASSPFGAEQAPCSQGASIQSSFATPVRRFATGARLPETADGAGDGWGMKMMMRMSLTTSPGESVASIETSGEQRDVSEMEVVQNSPSPSSSPSSSWVGLRTALTGFSLFKPEQESVMGGAPEGGLQGEGGSTKVSVGSSWEPTLSTVEAAATFKQRQGRASPSKSPSKLPRSSGSSSQSLEPPTSDAKTGDEGMERHTAKTAPATEPAAAASPAESSCGRCGLCVGVVSVLVVMAAAVCAFLLQRQAGALRATLAQVDTQLLRNEMNSQVFGQHIAVDVVPRSIAKYLGTVLRRQGDAGSQDACSLPPLVLSFHGWTGVGKNFVSSIVTGLFSGKTLTKLLVPYHFPHRHLDGLYRDQVEDWILSNVTDYSVNFFVVDEMDKATAGVTAGLRGAITKLREDNSCRSPVVFLLLSNSFGTDINQRVFEAMTNGEDRDGLSVGHFSDIFDGSKGGKTSWYDRLRSDITVAVPFLPLEKQHVVQCIRRHLVSRKLSTHRSLVSRVLQELMFTTLPSGQEFSQTGCKRVSDKVDLVAFV